MTICIIPARLHSTRFPKKLLAMACGKSVLQRTYECALDCKKIDELWVATDHQEIADHVQNFGGKVIWTAESCQNGTERIIDALQREPHLQRANIVINLQGDHPCTNANTLDRIAEVLIEDSETSISTAVRAIRNREDYLSPHVVKCVFDYQGRALYFSRSPIPYSIRDHEKPLAFQHIGIYGYRTKFLLEFSSMPESGLQRSEDLEQLQFLELGYTIRIAVVEDNALGIDTPNDLEKLERMINKQH
jgi:3-deoxy-manno-octulosonate cytidylyltransferase (CMP-KDO synthetase)